MESITALQEQKKRNGRQVYRAPARSRIIKCISLLLQQASKGSQGKRLTRRKHRETGIRIRGSENVGNVRPLRGKNPL